MASGDVRGLAADLRAGGRRVEAQAGQVVAKSGLAVQSGARTRATVDTGHMRSAIQVTTNGTQAVVTAHAYYSLYQEYGTSHGVPAVWFMRDSADEVEPSFVAAMERIGGDIL